MHACCHSCFLPQTLVRQCDACAQAFQQLPRDRLTALAVFCRLEDLPAGRVLATQGTPADRVYLIQEGEVALVREGDQTGNPMNPYERRASDVVVGGEYLAPGATSAMRGAADSGARAAIADDAAGPQRCTSILVLPCVSVLDA